MAEELMEKSVAKSTALMSAATLLSRITGLLRTWVMAFALGNTLITSAYQVANNMPNVIFDLVAGGLLGAAFIPVFVLQKERKGTNGANDFASNMLNLTIIVLGILTILATIFAPQVIATQTFTVGNEAEVSQYAIAFFRFFAIQIVFYGVSGVITGILNANRDYFIAGIAPAFNNIIVIISFLAYIPLSASNEQLAIVVLGIGASLGVAIQAFIQIPALKKTGYRFSLKVSLRDPALMEALKIAVPTCIYIVGTLVSFTFRNAYGLECGDKGPATLAYAWTWFQLPYGVIAVSVSRTMFTEMSEAVAKDDVALLRTHVKTGLSATLLLIIPLATLMGLFSTPIMELFRAGQFSSEDVFFVGDILFMWTFSLPFYSVLFYLYNVFASMRKFMRFAIISCVLVVVQCFLYWLLARPDVMGLYGIPAADFVYYGACSVILLIVLRKMIGSFGFFSVVWRSIKVFIASLIGGFLAYFISSFFYTESISILHGLAVLIIPGSIGLVAIFALCYLFRIPEMSFVTRIIKRFKRSRA